MRRRTHVELLRFVEERGHEIRPFRAELESVGAMRLDPSHPGACLLGRGHRALTPAGAGPLIHHITRRRDLVLRAPLLFVDGVGEARERNPADRRYALLEPALVVVLGLRRLLLSV